MEDANKIRAELESGLIGSILIEPEILGELCIKCDSEIFSVNEFRTIYLTLLDLYTDGKQIDRIILHAMLPDYDRVIDDCLHFTVTSANWTAYLEEIKKMKHMSQAQAMANRLLEMNTIHADMDEARQIAQNLLYSLDMEETDKKSYSIDKMLSDFIKRVGKKRPFLNLGIRTLTENLLVGSGEYIVIAARPSIGKTALALQFCLSIVRQGINVDFFSLETSQQRIMDRIITSVSNVSYENINKGTLSEIEMRRIMDSTKELYRYKKNFNLIEAAGMTIDDIKSKIIFDGAKVVFIDYMQLVRHPDRKLNEYQRVTEISLGIQEICKRYGVTVFALSQLSRNGDMGNPKLSDLRSSGQIEQDADTIMMLYRPTDYHDWENDRVIDVAKCRNGKVGTIDMFFQGNIQTFYQKDIKHS